MGGEFREGKGGGEEGGGAGKCATDYNEKSSLKKNYETNMYIHHTVYDTKSFYRYAEQTSQS